MCRAVRTLRAGDARGAWAACGASTGPPRLPYRIVIEVEAIEALRHERLRGRSRAASSRARACGCCAPKAAAPT